MIKFNDMSRTNKASINAMVSVVTNLIKLILGFISRAIFLKALGNDYLGINGVFYNILSILSFAELGIGSAITYSLYKPLANNDYQKINSYISLFKKLYIIIGIFVIIIGFCLTPFINYFIKDPVIIKENIKIIYILFLLNSASSYFFTHYRSLIIANQKQFLISIIDFIVNFLKDLIIIIILLFTGNYYLYLIINIFSTFSSNILISIIARMKYKFLDFKNAKKLESNELKNFIKNVKALILYKLGSIIFHGTDNILISIFIGVAYVGYLSNYNLIILSLTSIIAVIIDSLTASLGNLNSSDNTSIKIKVFYEVLFICQYIYGFASICLVLLTKDFIILWIGPNHLLNNYILMALVVIFYMNGMQFAPYTYRNTLGLYSYGKFIPLIGSFLNIIFSIIFLKLFGLVGVLIGTIISRTLSFFWFDPYIVYKKEFNINLIEYFLKYFEYFLVSILIMIINFLIVKNIEVNNILSFIIKTTIIFIISNILYILIYLKNIKNIIFRFKHIFSTFLTKEKYDSI